MYDYIIGRVSEVSSKNIVIDNQGIGYLIHTANPYSFEELKEYKIYLYQCVREDELTLYGFKTKEEKQLFLKLISVKGIGPKMALPILATGSVPGFVDAVERENVLYLKKFPKIGDKLAKQIILDLRGKLGSFTSDSITSSTSYDEITDVLKSLGYKDKDIKRIIPKINNELSIEEQVKEGLRLLLK